MIRRPAPDNASFLLITQHDHALAAARLAARVGNATFALPSPYQSVLDAVAHHDAGWPLHDDAPTLNSNGLPLHVFEVPVQVASRVWAESVTRAAHLGDYAALLVSLHVLNLSAWLAQHHGPDLSRPDGFEINKFQHRQIEFQQAVRARLGLSPDAPRRLGLADPGTSPADDQLLASFRLLTFMDRISLALCCGTLLFPTMDDVVPRPEDAATPITVTARMPDAATMTLSPWPFDRERVDLDLPARRVPSAPFADLAAFRRAYETAPRETVRLAVTCR